MHISIPVVFSDGKYIVKALNLSVEANNVLEAEMRLSETLTEAVGCVISVELEQRPSRPGYDLISPNSDVLIPLIEEIEPYYSRIPRKVDRKGLISMPTAEDILNLGYSDG